jgi:DNA-binding Xre family transcriptional regulator
MFLMGNRLSPTIQVMGQQLRQRLAQEIRRRRGEATYREFARRLGIGLSTLHRIENCEENVALDLLEQLCARLRCEVADLFPALDE